MISMFTCSVYPTAVAIMITVGRLPGMGYIHKFKVYMPMIT